MASNKNQHFVPRCYLRPFTVDTANKAINLFNIDREAFIEKAAVKHQCSGDYFYGQDADLERAIQAIEGQYSSVAREVQEPGYKLVDEDRSALKMFWLFQHLRTEAASRRAVEMTETMTSTAGLDPSEFRLNIKEAVVLSMQAFAEEISIVEDLKTCLILNKSDTPFITSDDPAIITNRWHIKTEAVQHISFGLQSAGLICILPLSPTILMLAYDGDVYSVPRKNGWSVLKASSDADAFNQHQYLNCRANIFIKDPSGFDQIRAGYSSVAASRPGARHRVNYAVKVESDGDYERYKVVDPATAKTQEDALIHTQSIHPVPKSWPRQIRWRGNAVAYTNGTGIGYVRKAYADRRKGPPFRKRRILRDKL